MKTPIIFFGSSSYVLPVLEMLHKKYDLKLVITTEQKPTDSVISYCLQHGISYVSVLKCNEAFGSTLLALQCPIAVLADFRLLIPKEVMNSFPKGIVNIHPSLLPEYRGPTPGTSAILDGKETTGVSLMVLDTKLDHGPLLGQTNEHILPTDTSATLYPRLFQKGAGLLEKVLPEYLEGKMQPTPQDNSKATYTDFLTRESGFIDLEKFHISHSTFHIDNAIRAYFPWPTVWTLYRIKNKEVRIKFLPEQKIQVEGKKPVSYKDFINGYPEGKELLEKLGLYASLS